MPRVTTSAGRYYEYKDQKYPSVTTILSRGIPKPGLIKWAGKMVAQAAVERLPEWIEKEDQEAIDWLAARPDERKNTAANLGTYLHAAVERISLGQEINKPADEVQASYLRGFEQFVRDVGPKYLFTEFEIYNSEHGYAGSGDAIIRIGNTTWIIDTKTGTKVRPEVALQLSAYRRADFILIPHKDKTDGRKTVYEEVKVPKIRKSGVIHLFPDGYQFVEVRSDDEVFDVFLAAKQLYEWDSALSRVVIREVVAPK
jgi:hypothetical protein